MVIKSRMTWAGHAACMDKMRNIYKLSVRKSEEITLKTYA
jgi:hypothetical protein